MLARNNLTATLTLNGFQAGNVYRFKFLNNNFDDQSSSDVVRISFAYGACNASDYRESFTIIGADSSLFDRGIPDQTHFVLAQA